MLRNIKKYLISMEDESADNAEEIEEADTTVKADAPETKPDEPKDDETGEEEEEETTDETTPGDKPAETKVEEVGPDLDEQGSVSTVDEKETVAGVSDDNEVVVKDDTAAQVDPDENVAPNTSTDVGATGPVNPTAAEADDAEVMAIKQQATAMQDAQKQIVEAAGAAAEGGDGAVDSNGNAITDEQGEANAEEEQRDADVQSEVDAEAEETAKNADDTPATDDIEGDAASGDEGGDSGSDDYFDDSGDNATGDSTDDALGDDAGGDAGDLGGDEAGGAAGDESGTDGDESSGDDSGVDDSGDDLGGSGDSGDTGSDDSGDDTGATDETQDVEVDAEQDLTPAEVDGTPADLPGAQDDTAATVEEGGNADESADVAEDESEAVDDTVEEIQEDAGPDFDEMAEADGEVDEDAGEVEDTGEPADLDEGELDVEDVDTDTTEEDVADAEVEAEETEVEADTEEADGEEAEKTIAELQEEKESVEKYIDILKFGLENNSFQSQFVLLAQDKLEALQSSFGVKRSPALPALESYGAKQLDGYYLSALKSFKGFAKRIDHFAGDLKTRIGGYHRKALVEKVTTRATAINKAADLALVKLAKSKMDGTVKVRGVTGAIATNQQHLPSAVASDLKTLVQMAGKGLKANLGMHRSLVGSLESIGVNYSNESFVSSELDNAATIKVAIEAYDTEAFGEGFIGNERLVKSAAGIPSVEKFVSVEARCTVFDLDKSELADLGIMAKAYTALATKLAKTTGRTISNELFKEHIKGADHARVAMAELEGANRVSVEALSNSLESVHKANRELYSFTTDHALKVASALVNVINKAMQ